MCIQTSSQLSETVAAFLIADALYAYEAYHSTALFLHNFFGLFLYPLLLVPIEELCSRPATVKLLVRGESIPLI